MKLKQKQFLKGSREFEIIDDTVFVRIKSLFKEEKLTVDLSSLDPEPVINGSELAFFSRYKGRPVLSLLVNNPNADEFNAFVDALKQGAPGEQNTAAGDEAGSPESAVSEALARNVYEEPAWLKEDDEVHNKVNFEPVNAERVADDINMLKTYLDEENIRPLLDSLESLKAEPNNEAAFQKVTDAYNELGIQTGAVLTYAPYLKALLSKAVL